ncbi:hypothetical protein EIP86_007926 [Pleurotus ostreatoroseus]|nr:hypothetical protein EIP86_007926 [Pleurotus ostreatoroseus]
MTALRYAHIAKRNVRVTVDIIRDKVLATIQDKLNNPSPDDPFEPEIAAIFGDREGMDEEVSLHVCSADLLRPLTPNPSSTVSSRATVITMAVRFLTAVALSAFVSSATGLNILLSNDDSWASANIRATFNALVAAGHNVLMSAPAIQESGHGGTFVLPTTNIVPPGGEFNSIPVGAPFFGHDVHNQNLFYFNGTPAAAVIFGIDILAPQHFKNEKIDLVVAGPNEGQNNGPFLYTISGTIGATYAAVERGIPGIAISAGNGTHRSFTTNTGKADDPANIAARLTVNFVEALAKGVDTKKERLLPLGLGLNLNMPTFGPGNSCVDPPFILTRMTRGATIDKMSLNPKTGFPETTDINTPALNVVLSGDPILPDETDVSAGCATSVSVFSIDYDAPTGDAQPVQLQLLPLIGKSKLA